MYEAPFRRMPFLRDPAAGIGSRHSSAKNTDTNVTTIVHDYASDGITQLLLRSDDFNGSGKVQMKILFGGNTHLHDAKRNASCSRLRQNVMAVIASTECQRVQEFSSRKCNVRASLNVWNITKTTPHSGDPRATGVRSGEY